MSHNKPSRLRFAINLGNAVLAHLGETGKPAGITVELSHRLATRWGVSAEFVPYPAAGKVVADAGRALGYCLSGHRSGAGSHPALYLALYHHPGHRAGQR